MDLPAKKYIRYEIGGSLGSLCVVIFLNSNVLLQDLLVSLLPLHFSEF